MNTKIDSKIMRLVESYKTVTYTHEYNIKKNKKERERVYISYSRCILFIEKKYI